MKVLPRIPASRLALWSFSNLPNLRLEVGTRRISTRAAATPCALSAPILLTRGARTMHSAAPRGAKVAPMVGAGPPPLPPMSEDMASGRATASKDKKPDAYRWWKGVLVKEEDGAFQVCLEDKNPLQKRGLRSTDRSIRHPVTKQPIPIPLSKPHLATALALEWDVLRSVADATRSHLIPLTSLTCRALDTVESEAQNDTSIREYIIKTVMRYLETDTLLCWAPEVDPRDPSAHLNSAGQSLRHTQREAAEAVVAYLTANVWPGIGFVPVLDGQSIFPNRQREDTLAVVRGWLAGMTAWELVGLERAVLATKSLLLGARLLAEWSEGPVGVRGRGREAEGEAGKVFGVEEAARLASLEVSWQTGRWGEVEDTHDVDREDLRRQLGSVVLLVSGTGR